MQYDADTYRLYNDLFQEAHATLCVKEAQKQPGLIRRGLSALFGSGKGADELKFLREQTARQEQAIQDAAHRMAQTEADVAVQMSRAAKAEQQAAQRAESLKRFAEDPDALAKAQQSGKLWKGVGMGAAGLGAVGIPTAAYLGHQKGEAGKKRTRNIAFGAGAAAGLAAPQIVRGLGQIARGAGQTGLFPELQGYGEY
jgi:hypothetical protein